MELEVWEGWEEERGGLYKRLIEGMVKCDAHVQAAEAAAQERDRQRRRALYVSALSSAYLPKVLRGLKWSDFDREEPEDFYEGEKLISAADASKTRVAALEQARRWAAGEIRGLVLAGAVGIGKSRLAAIAAQDLIYHTIKRLTPERLDKPAMPIRWVRMPALIHMSKGEYRSDRRREAEKIISGGAALVLDDIDKTQPTEVSLDLIFEALESRMGHGAPVLITTNMRYEALEEHIGHPIASRIAGYCAGCRILGADRRQF